MTSWSCYTLLYTDIEKTTLFVIRLTRLIASLFTALRRVFMTNSSYGGSHFILPTVFPPPETSLSYSHLVIVRYSSVQKISALAGTLIQKNRAYSPPGK